MAARRKYGAFRGVELTVERRNNRLLTHTPQGNLFGYIAKGQEDAVAAAAVLRVVYAHGNNRRQCAGGGCESVESERRDRGGCSSSISYLLYLTHMWYVHLAKNGC